MLALSTVYFTLREEELTGDEVGRGALDLGFRSLELDYRITLAQLKGLRTLIDRGTLTAVSVHHPFPRPPHVPPETAHTGGPLFTSLDREERSAALRRAVETLAHAGDLGAGVVVLHLGRVDLPAPLDARDLERRVREGTREDPEYEVMRREVDAARRACSPAYLDAALSSLDRLAGEALKRGVSLGLENRYHPDEIPDPRELRVIFETLEGAPLGYWHDTGHAASLAALGFLDSPVEGLEAHVGSTLGFHLHDARGLEDHLAPGEGEVDFAALAPLVKASALKVLEVKPRSTPEALDRAREVLREAGVD